MSKIVEAHILREYALLRQMGSGAYGHVWQAKQKKTNKVFALKKVFDAFRNSIDAQRTYRQVQVLHQMNHANIVKLYRVMKSKNNKDLYLLFQFMEADLHSVVGTTILEKMHQVFIFYQTLKGIHYIHTAELIHRDLKPSNVLINSECSAKVCDFGLIRSLASNQPVNNQQQIVLSQEVATKWYRAPQLLLGSRNYGKPVDIWSFGCIVAEILTGKPLFAGSSTLNQFQKILGFTGYPTKQDIQSLQSPIAQQLLDQIKIKQKSFRQYFHGVDPIFYELIEATLNFNPSKRMSTDELFKIALFQEFIDDNIISADKPIIPQINDNMRYSTKAYREKIYLDIDQRYSPLPFKQIRVDQFKQYSLDSKKITQKNRSNSNNSTKKRALSSKKKISTVNQSITNKARLLSDIINKNKSGLNTSFKKVSHSGHSGFIKNSPYYKSLNYQNSSSASSLNNNKYYNGSNQYHRINKNSQMNSIKQKQEHKKLQNQVSMGHSITSKSRADSGKVSHTKQATKQVLSPYTDNTQSCKVVKHLKKGARHKLQQIDKKNILRSIGVSKSQKLVKYIK